MLAEPYRYLSCIEVLHGTVEFPIAQMIRGFFLCHRLLGIGVAEHGSWPRLLCANLTSTKIDVGVSMRCCCWLLLVRTWRGVFAVGSGPNASVLICALPQRFAGLACFFPR